MDPIGFQRQLRNNQTDLVDYYKDLAQWGEEMKRKDEFLRTGTEPPKVEAPPRKNKTTKPKLKPDKPNVETKKVRSLADWEKFDVEAECAKVDEEDDSDSGELLVEETKLEGETLSAPPKIEEVKQSPGSKTKNKNKSKVKPKRVKSYDYWEKFDADAECARLDDEGEGENSGDLTDEYDETTIDKAYYEKEKGNKFVKNQKWDQAIECYTKAIEYHGYDPVFYANRALCYLKKQNYPAAESDSTRALQLDKTYVKAYQRRAAAREALNQLTEAHADLLKVFDYEANNKESKAALVKLEKKLESFNKEASSKKADVQRPVSKFTMSRQQQKREIKPKASSLKSETIEKSIPKIESSNQTYWPSGNEVEIIQVVHKPPHLRSKKPLKRITVQDVDTLSFNNEKPVDNKAQPWPKPEGDDKVIRCDDFKVVERKIEDYNEEKVDFKENRKESKFTKKKTNQIISDTNKIDQNDLDFNFVIPETSVQFNTDWRILRHKPEFRYRYLKQVNPKKFSTIFKESLDYDIFTGIIHTLAETFIEKGIPVYEYLLGLCEVKRFSMLSMFMTDDDKKDMLRLMDYMRSDSNLANNNVDNLLSKYGL